MKYHLGRMWYRSHFPLKKQLKNKITGEKSTDYIFHPLAPERIKQLGLNPKIIILLRDPVLRAVSQYYHFRRRGRETRSLKEAFQTEFELTQKLYPALFKNTLLYKRKIQDYLRTAYMKKGLYLEQIKRYRKWFAPEQLLVEATENLLANPKTIGKKVYRFLGIDPDFVPANLRLQNAGKYELDAEAKAILPELRQYYKPANEMLFEYLGKRFPWN